MLAAGGWQTPLGLPDDVLRSATTVSGLHELWPLRHTFVNHWLELDAEAARRNSPLLKPPRAGMPIVVSWGGMESSEFARQSLDYAAMCRAAGAITTIAGRPRANHLSIIGELADPESPMFAAMARHIVPPRT